MTACAAVLVAVAVPGANGAGTTGTASSVRHTQALLGTRTHAALLSLYSLDARLDAARRRAASLAAHLEDVRAEQARTARDRRIAQRAWSDSVAALGAHLRALYEHGQPDAVAILFGASSIDDAMTRIDAVARSAEIDRQTIEQTRAAQRTLRALEQQLASRAAELETLVAQAHETTAALERTRAARVAYIGSLRRERMFTLRRIAQLDSVARRSAARSDVAAVQQEQTAAAPIGAPPSPPAPPAAGQTLTVTATGYALAGTTATGLPVGPGVVAVDPSVIPLGTRMTIPGYGEGVAADTGTAVQGPAIDLWFATDAQARAWGRRTLTITLH